MVDISKLPLWKDMPRVEGMPQGCAWGLFDHITSTGAKVKDELGTLNLLTPQVVAQAASEIRTGISVSLNWSMDRLHKPGFGRVALEHDVIDCKHPQTGSWWFDDTLKFNTQAGSQWDGLRHWGLDRSQMGWYYGCIRHDELLKSGKLGIETWSKRGGIVGRGVLLDYVRYKERRGEAYEPMSEHRITFQEIQEMIREEELEIRPGDILLVRSGWIKWYEEHSPEEREQHITNGSAWVGVDGCEGVVEWLWNSRFAAVAGDSIGFEAWPAKKPWRLHDLCLAMWGMPIGEMWDLEELAAECERQNRWSFFLTSSPLNVPGGIASPPNALAVF